MLTDSNFIFMVMEMQLAEIIKDEITYPLSNIMALLIYIILGFIVGVVEVLTGTTRITTGSMIFEYGIILGIIGIGKVIITMIASATAGFITVFVLSFISGLILISASSTIITIAVSIVSVTLDGRLLFYENRVIGLL